MGRFQLIMSVCSFAVTFAASGISFAAMRLVAEGLGERRNADLKKIMLKCFLYAAFFGVLSFILLFFLSDILADRFLHYKTASLCLKIFSVTLPAVSFLSAISGYFTAVRRVYKDSAVKIIVQLSRLLLTVAFLSSDFDPCVMIMAAAACAELAGAVFSASLYFADRRKNKSSHAACMNKILPIALPIAFSTYLRSGIMTVKNLLVPVGLIKSGMTPPEAAAAFGIIHGIALPVVLFPSAFLFSFSALTVPELARVYSGTEDILSSRRITYMIERSVQLTLLFAIAAAGIIFIFADSVCKTVSGSTEALVYIKILALIIPVMYLDNTIDSMLKGLNEQVSSMKFNIIDSSVSLLLVIFLLPKSGLMGYVLIIAAGEILNFILSLRRLGKVATVKIHLISHILLPTLSVAAACLGVRLIFPHTPFFVNAVLCVLVYYLLVNISGSFSGEDRRWLKNSL